MISTLDFQSDFGRSWWLEPETGEVLFCTEDGVEETGESADDLEERGAVMVDALSSRDAYRDMETFISGVEEGPAKDRLWRAISGNRPVRRFKDALFDFPGMRERWFAFHDRVLRRYAVEWLVDVGVWTGRRPRRPWSSSASSALLRRLFPRSS
ncbi:UPF0158 family protein [Pseudarthrobacter sp. S9]|uniref:UPF0158 family protein n=1 Tax=Pseudarthrobacter sp. S9 TaxID=3418421 RepID=UPI003D015D39